MRCRPHPASPAPRRRRSATSSSPRRSTATRNWPPSRPGSTCRRQLEIGQHLEVPGALGEAGEIGEIGDSSPSETKAMRSASNHRARHAVAGKARLDQEVGATPLNARIAWMRRARLGCVIPLRELGLEAARHERALVDGDERADQRVAVAAARRPGDRFRFRAAASAGSGEQHDEQRRKPGVFDQSDQPRCPTASAVPTAPTMSSGPWL